METTVYGDILFLVNFCMDFVSLFLTARLLHRRFFVWRAVLFASLGGVYACFALFWQVSGVLALCADIAVCFLMCAGTYTERGESPRRILLPFAVYFGVSFALGGAMSGLSSLLAHLTLPIGREEAISPTMLVILAVFGALSTLLWGRFHRAGARGKRGMLTADFAGRHAELRCVVDTGNLLHDPLGGRPVALLGKQGTAQLLPPELAAVIEAGDPAALAGLPAALAAKVRLIPAKTATGGGILFALPPDNAVLDMGKGRYGVTLLLAPAELGEQDFDVLLPAELVIS